MALKIQQSSADYLLWLLVFLASLLCRPVLAYESCLTKQQQLAKVTEWHALARIIDGDTIQLKGGRKVRLIGINTPELGHRAKPSQAFAKQAFKRLKKLLAHQQKVGLSYDQEKHDRYHRILAYVSLKDGRSLEQILLAEGLAQSIVVPPNDSRIICYRKIEEHARNSKLGIWQLAENQWEPAEQLSSRSKGFRFVYGTISAYSESRKSIYLTLTSKLSIRIAKQDKRYFPTVQFKKLLGKSVRVRGWLSTYKGRQSIYVRTEHDLKL